MKIIIYVPVQQKKNSDSSLTLDYFLYLLELPHRVDQDMWAGRIGGFVEDDVHKVSAAFVQTDGRVENCPSRYKNKKTKTVKQLHRQEQSVTSAQVCPHLEFPGRSRV